MSKSSPWSGLAFPKNKLPFRPTRFLCFFRFVEELDASLYAALVSLRKFGSLKSCCAVLHKTEQCQTVYLQERTNWGPAINMRLSLVFELLLIFILLAFAASRVIGEYSPATLLQPEL